MNKRKSLFHSLTEPFHLFYLGFLASVGLAFGSAMIINVLKELIKLQFGFENQIYSEIAFLILYLPFIVYTYKFLDMRKGGALRNGFILFTILYILERLYIYLRYL
ncbi:hypothetical protein HYS72_00405 [Candidatus Pacearchaeota archaeon]|nr:hypothetical protein [Candidatus Pacearchaeota archaeon]